MLRKGMLLLAAAMMTLGVFCVPAGAVTAIYPTTQSFLNEMDQENINYNWRGVDNNNLEKVEVSFEGDYMEDIETIWFFEQDPDRVRVRIWNIITYADSDYQAVLDVVNNLNYTYLYVNFLADTSDNTVTLKYDMPVEVNSAGELCVDMMYRLIGILDDEYPTLQKYDIYSAGQVQPDTGSGGGEFSGAIDNVAVHDDEEEEKQPKF